MAWFTLGAAVVHNLIQYEAGRITICGVTRAVVPKPVFIIAYPVAAWLLGRHVWKGYKP